MEIVIHEQNLHNVQHLISLLVWVVHILCLVREYQGMASYGLGSLLGYFTLRAWLARLPHPSTYSQAALISLTV